MREGLEEGEDGWGQGVLFDAEVGEGDGEVEAAGACAAWVEVEDVVAGFGGGLVGVAADDGGEAGGGGVQVEVVDGVDEVEEGAVELDDVGWGQVGAGAVGVDVAADGGDGGYGAEGAEDLDVADVAGMENMIDAVEGGDGLGAEEAVGVGDDADEHGSFP